MAAKKLDIHFHNPNSEENTYKIISETLTDICVRKIKEKILEDNTEPMITSNDHDHSIAS
ncbi:hypothetical protein [Huintestinicola sp.]|uniref:hypothetical protein n=1 Tax=Huintestinicola sp. TaxID=2981661 RepID=UPI003D7C5F33